MEKDIHSLNPYLSKAINASRRCVYARVLLDSYVNNIEDEKDNDQMVALINRFGTSKRIPLVARCADLSKNEIDKIFNKGRCDSGFTICAGEQYQLQLPQR